MIELDPGRYIAVDTQRFVVIDPEDREQVKRLALAYSGVFGAKRAVPEETRAMQAALRSLVAEPEPEEPTGLGAVVLAAGEMYVIDKTTTTVRRWKRARGKEGGRRHAWADLPRPLEVRSEGWQEEAEDVF